MTQRNKRLSGNDRDRLLVFATKRVEETEDRTALDAAYDAAAQAVHDAVVERFPQKDMRVLAKYDAAAGDSCIYVSAGGGFNYDLFCFRDGDKRIPLRPGRGGCNALLLEGDRRAAYDDYGLGVKAYELAVHRRMADYRALITGVSTFNDVASVWPEAEHLRTTLVGSATAMIILSEEVVERLKADPANVSELEPA